MNNRNTGRDESMTTAEAGRKGGETVKNKYGPDYYSRIGQKGGQRVRELIEQGEEAERRR